MLIRFYHIAGETPAAADAVLPPLLEKARQAGLQVLLVCPSEGRATRLDETLWTYADDSFLPHTLAEAETSATQARAPVLLATPDHPISDLARGRLAIILAGAEAAFPALLGAAPEQGAEQGNDKLFYLFHAAPPVLENARAHWKAHKSGGHALEYWQETAGKWQKKQ